mmetsp:Transcript_23635/g.60312  ORF Transcript_23635/g.60312 Transcript_23635/m.60312 type:complete len:85 (+) Transcript_23635:116-370(+)
MAEVEQRMRELREYRAKLAAEGNVTHKPVNARVTHMLQPLSNAQTYNPHAPGQYHPFAENNERKGQGISAVTKVANAEGTHWSP